jgi:hypothetical protein
LEKRLSSTQHKKWLTKMKRFDFAIIYKKGKDNVVANALSRIEEASILYSIPMWFEETLYEWKNDNDTKQKIQCIKEGMNSMEHWEWKGDILWYKGRICLCPQSKLKQQILRESHDTMSLGHAWFLKTYQRIKNYFFWEGMKKYIQKFVRECQVFKRNKGEIINIQGYFIHYIDLIKDRKIYQWTSLQGYQI